MRGQDSLVNEFRRQLLKVSPAGEATNLLMNNPKFGNLKLQLKPHLFGFGEEAWGARVSSDGVGCVSFLQTGSIQILAMPFSALWVGLGSPSMKEFFNLVEKMASTEDLEKVANAAKDKGHELNMHYFEVY